MQMFTVTVVEEVVERRTYTIEANSSKDAATMARKLWVDHGQEPSGGSKPSVTVKERTFEVLSASTFDESELLEEKS